MNKVYLINTNLTEETNKNLNSNLSEKDQQSMLDLDLKLSIDLVSEDNLITSVVICNQINLEKMKEFFKNNNVDVNIQDATDIFTSDLKSVDDLIEEDIIEKMCKDVESEK